MNFLFHTKVPHSVSCTVLNQGGDVLEYAHACPGLVGVQVNMPELPKFGTLSKRFCSSLRSFPVNDVISCCSAARRLITWAVLPGG